MDVWQQLGVAVALVLVIEGTIPFISPGRWRKLVVQVAATDDGTLRAIGLVSMLVGLALLYLVN